MTRKQYPRFDQYLSQTDHSHLRHKFPGIELVDRNYSQAFQDLFVISVLDGKRNGSYLELGASYPAVISNTFLLEKYFGWKGIGIDLNESTVKQHQNLRNNPCYLMDALSADYKELLAEFEERIDYLQVDVCVDDDSTYNFLALERVLNTGKKFNVITFETNVYQVGTSIQKKGHDLLASLGYSRIAKDVVFNGEIFEDWYVDLSTVDWNIAKKFVSDGTHCQDIMFDW